MEVVHPVNDLPQDRLDHHLSQTNHLVTVKIKNLLKEEMKRSRKEEKMKKKKEEEERRKKKEEEQRRMKKEERRRTKKENDVPRDHVLHSERPLQLTCLQGQGPLRQER